MKIGDVLLNEKTKVSLSIINFLLLFGFIITAVFTAATWSKDVENKIENNRIEISREIDARKEADELTNKKLDEVMPLLTQNQTDMAGIKTDLEWIKSMQVQIWERMNK